MVMVVVVVVINDLCVGRLGWDEGKRGNGIITQFFFPSFFLRVV
jgi:hypothetical protein